MFETQATDRRQMLRALGLGMLGTTASTWFAPLASAARQAANETGRRRHCILLWMNGGPSQTDTFDMKPQHTNGGPFKEISTAAAELRFSEHLPGLAQHADRLAVVRSLVTKEGDHARGAHVVRTGFAPTGDITYPAVGCTLAKEMATGGSLLPNYVSIAPQTQLNPAAFGPGFLGARHAPAVVAAPANATPPGDEPDGPATIADLRLDNIAWPDGVEATQATRRMQLWNQLQRKFLRDRRVDSFAAHHALYQQASEMMRPEVRAAFDLTREPTAVRERYGTGVFGQGCLLARRLVERGVPFVEVALGDGLAWDTHADNFTQVEQLSRQLDAGWATLMMELRDRGLLDFTTIVWMGEFGRTPVINPTGGRDHFPNAWSCVLGGGGIAGGQAYGRTSPDGMTVEEGKCSIGDILATLATASGVSPDHENMTSMGRPIRVAEGSAIPELLA